MSLIIVEATLVILGAIVIYASYQLISILKEDKKYLLNEEHPLYTVSIVMLLSFSMVLAIIIYSIVRIETYQ